MAFIQIIATQGAVILRHKHSELVILPQHVENLQKLKNQESLVNIF